MALPLSQLKRLILQQSMPLFSSFSHHGINHYTNLLTTNTFCFCDICSSSNVQTPDVRKLLSILENLYNSGMCRLLCVDHNASV